jgi:hypothetical protein
MALLLTSVFGVAGCGSDDDVQVESRVKNAAPEASGVSDGPSAAPEASGASDASTQADCDLLDRLDLDDGLDDLLDSFDSLRIDDLHKLLDALDDLPDLRWLIDRRLGFHDLYDLYDLLELLDRRDLVVPPYIGGAHSIDRLGLDEFRLDLDDLEQVDRIMDLRNDAWDEITERIVRQGNTFRDQLDRLEDPDRLEQFGQCGAASDGGATARKGDDVDGG